MNKRDIYYKYAQLPEDDGTFAQYYNYYEKHPQQNEEILQRACEEFSSYVGFNMDIVVKYKSKKDQKYRQVAFEDDDELDYEDYKIRIFWKGTDIYPETDLNTIDYPDIKGLIKMHKLKEGYTGIFKRLLRGESFLQ